MEIAHGMEAAAKQSKELNKGGAQRGAPVLVVDTPDRGRCGRGNHNASECRFKTATCHKCAKVGHIAPTCRSGQKKPQPAKNTRWVDSTQPCLSTPCGEEPLFVVRDRSSPPYRVQLEVLGKSLTMEVDTGAAVSLAPESVVSSLLSATPPLPSSVILKTYTGEQIHVKGSLTVEVK